MEVLTNKIYWQGSQSIMSWWQHLKECVILIDHWVGKNALPSSKKLQNFSKQK